MKKLILLAVIFNYSYINAQKHNELENYDWKKLKKVTLFNFNKVNTDSDSLLLKSLENNSDKINCSNIKNWKRAFSTLRNTPRDVAYEKDTFIILLELENKKQIPIIYFPNQKSIYYLRKDYLYYDSFPKKSKLIKTIFNSCLEKLKKERD